MRKRIGYVSNSSSTSFVLDKKKLTPYQIKSVLNPKEASADLKVAWCQHWDITDKGDTIHGDITFDNGDMFKLLKALDIKEDAIIEWWDSNA